MVKGQKLALVLMSVFFLVQLRWTRGHVITSLAQYTSTYAQLCFDTCRPHYNKYFWCTTDQGWDYCSPSHNVTYRNDPCRSDHWCDTHGYHYYWCFTDSSWDYCGFIKTDSTIIRQKRQPNNIIEICSVKDSGNRKVTTITAEPNIDAITDGTKWMTEIKGIIVRWDNSYLVDQAKSKLITTKNLRIDLQQLVKRNNQYYYNLQIQLNKRRDNNQSTTVAQVLTPKNEDVPRRYVRRAFLESYQHRARVFVDVRRRNIPARHGQNCD